MLSISHRKIGTRVACPKCRAENVVPDAEAGAASVAMAVCARPEADFQAIPEVIVYDDVGELIAGHPTAAPAVAGPPVAGPPVLPPPDGGRPAGALPARSPPAAPRDPPAVKLRPPRRVEEEMLLVSRRAVYAQGVLFSIVALIFFVAGYLIGRGGTSAVGEAGANAEPVVFQGNLVYSRSPGEVLPDAEAVIIALPEEKRPDRKLATSGLGPQDAGDHERNPSVAAIEKLGGAYARADDTGAFQLVVPRPGDYYLLLISRHARRPRGQGPQAADLLALAEYFQLATDLVGQNKYDWSLESLAGAPVPFTHEFGMDGR